VAALEDSFAEAAGVPSVVETIEEATRTRAGRATGWPVTSWTSRLRPDPLKRLNLELGEAGRHLTGRVTSAMPRTTQVQRARIDTEVRAVADDVSAPLARPWADAVRRASTSRLTELNDRLDAALAETELDVDRMPVWTRLVRVLQWLLLLIALVGAVWLVVLAVDPSGGADLSSAPGVGGVPAPLVMLVGGVVLGLLVALVCRLLVSGTARSRARATDHRLRAAIGGVAEELVVAPVNAELAAYDRVRTGLERALR
jgi:hypothetical protein